MRAIWIGTISPTFSIASIVGPVIGGALTQVSSAVELYNSSLSDPILSDSKVSHVDTEEIHVL
jgi:hypothetical protein